MIWTKVELDQKISELGEFIHTNEFADLLSKDKSSIANNLRGLLEHTVKGKSLYFSRETVVNYLTNHSNYHCLLINSPEYMSVKEIKEEYSGLFMPNDAGTLFSKYRDSRITLQGFNYTYKYPRVAIKVFYERRAEIQEKRNEFDSKGLSYEEVRNSEEYIFHIILRKELECPDWYIKHLIQNGQLPNSISFSNHNGNCFVHIDDVATLKQKFEDKVVFGNHSLSKFKEEKEPLDRFLNIVKNYSMESTYPYTHALYEQFVIQALNTSQTHHIFNLASAYSLPYVSLGELLTKEVHLLSSKEVVFILNQDIYKKHKLIIIKFLKFVKTRIKTNYSTVPSLEERAITQIENTKPYTKEEYFKMYRSVIDIRKHIEKAISDPVYCQDWFHLLMAFSNAWRMPDIANFPLPNIKILNIENHSFNWYKTNRLSIEQGLRLILDIQTNHRLIINKSGSLNELFVPNDMVVPISSAITLLELHRLTRAENQDTLMPAFQKNERNGKVLKRLFGDGYPYFSLRRTTKSLLTYSYLTATEMQTHAGAANAISTRLRGHRNIDSIQNYVLPTVEDASDSAVHLFRRGHFGYLYSLLVDLSIKQKDTELSLEEKTKTIEALMGIFSPQDLEDQGAFYFEQREKLLSVSQQVIKLKAEEINERLDLIYNGDMPSYKLEAQCFVSGNCTQPGRNCNSCKYLIPKVNFLNSTKSELFDLIKELNNTEEREEVRRIKLTHLILSLLGVVNQAAKTFGKDYAAEFIDFQELKLQLTTVQNKMLE